MLYKKNGEKELSKELFKNPTSEFRGTPFWAWNSLLEKNELERQIEVFKEMGLGGFICTSERVLKINISAMNICSS